MSVVAPDHRSKKVDATAAPVTTKWILIPESREGHYYQGINWELIIKSPGNGHIETTNAAPGLVKIVNGGGSSDFVKSFVWGPGTAIAADVQTTSKPVTAYKFVVNAGILLFNVKVY